MSGIRQSDVRPEGPDPTPRLVQSSSDDVELVDILNSSPATSLRGNGNHNGLDKINPNGTHWNDFGAHTLARGVDQGTSRESPKAKGRSNQFTPNAPYSSYATSALPSSMSNYGTRPMGTVGIHYPREVVRVERDWSGGDVAQFHTSFPMELEGRITQPQFQHLINEINSHLQSAYSPQSAFWENVLAILTWHTSLFWWRGRFETELRKVEQVIERANDEVYNGLGLNVLSPRHVGLQFLEIEYY